MLPMTSRTCEQEELPAAEKEFGEPQGMGRLSEPLHWKPAGHVAHARFVVVVGAVISYCPGLQAVTAESTQRKTREKGVRNEEV
jgi:hypothetical protein